MTGRGRAFGLCANEFSPSDGKVVSLDHGCGAHSEAEPEPLQLLSLTWWWMTCRLTDSTRRNFLTMSSTRPTKALIDSLEDEADLEVAVAAVDEVIGELEAQAGDVEVEEVSDSQVQDRLAVDEQVADGELKDLTANADGGRREGQAVGAGLVGVCLLTLTGCTQPTPDVTVVWNPSVVRPATCWEPESTVTGSGQGCIAEAQSKPTSDIPSIAVSPGSIVGINVDPQVAEATWLPSVGQQPLAESPISGVVLPLHLSQREDTRLTATFLRSQHEVPAQIRIADCGSSGWSQPPVALT